MSLTLAQRFGTNATIDTTTANHPKLVIDLLDLDDALVTGGISNPATITEANAKADRILTALLLLSKQNQPATNTVDTAGIYIGAPTKTLVVRNSVNQVQYAQQVSIYTPDPTVNLDTDNVV